MDLLYSLATIDKKLNKAYLEWFLDFCSNINNSFQ